MGERTRFLVSGFGAAEWWERLPEETRARADELVLRDAVFQAVRVVWEAGRPGGLPLLDAQRVVEERYVHHGDRVVRDPAVAPDPEALAAEAAVLPGRVVAIEAVWDGDTVHDWFVDLLALTDDPEDEHRLATLYQATPVHPGSLRRPAGVADAVGRAVAARLGVPFHFASPHTPDDTAPRWRP
ncbi:hypothetical protein ABZ464_15920 [Streptomyces sp. NPDC005820]|uniref:hypothetical protein n=1 Tax=Streptomyces sp. NPDC005820 TaxID=3157069 RepID=UPI003405E536